MGSAKKVASGVIWGTLVNIVNAIYGFISVPILINYFGKAEYGLIGLAMSINVYMQLMDMGFNSTNVRFFSNWLAKKDYAKTQKLFQTCLAFYGLIGLLNAIILFVVSLYTSSLFNLTQEQNTILKNLVYVLCISAVISWISSCFDQIIRATESVGWLQRRSLIPKLLQIIILFVTVYIHLNIEWYFILTTFAVISIIPLSINKIRLEVPFVNFIPKFDKVVFKEILPYSIGIFSFSLFQFSFYNLRPVFLGIQGSIESVADFRVLNGIIGLVTMLGGSFLNALLPSASKVVAQHNKEAYYRIAYDGTKYISIALCFCCFGMMSVGKEVISMYVGESFLYLIPWFNLWLLCSLTTHNQAISSLILSGTNIKAITYNTIIASITGLVLSWFLIPYLQIGGVVIALVVYSLVQLLFYYCYYWPKEMDINPVKVFLYSFLPYFVLGLFLAILCVCIHLKLSNFMLFLIKGSLFTLLFVISLFFILNKNDKVYMKNILHLSKDK